MRKWKQFLLNAVIMTATSLLLNSTGVWFNLYISNKIGAEGMGVFQLLMSVNSLAITLAASGIGLASTRLVAEELALPNGCAKAAMRRCLAYSLFFGTVAGAALFFGAPLIGTRWLCSAETIRPLRVIALGMPCLALSCALGGYFTAVRRVAKSAAASVLEQFLRITLTMAALNLLVPPGLEYACLAITCSGLLAEAASFVFEYAVYLFDRRRYQGSHGSRRLTRKLFGIALPVAFSSYLRSGLMTFKNLLVPIRLQRAGVSSGEALSMFGTVHGVALQVILFPYAFLSAFNSLIIPELAQYHTQERSVNGMVRKIFGLTLCFSFGVCGALLAFSGEIGAAVSKNPDVGSYIRLLAPVIPVMYLDTAVDNILKGINEQVSVMRYNVFDALLSMVGVWLLLPVFGIKGYIFVICASEIFNFTLSLSRLVAVTQVRLDILERIVKPILCIAIAVLCAGIPLHAGILPASPSAQAFALCAISGVLYFALIYISGWARLDS